MKNTEQPKPDIASYENKVQKGYSELGNDNLDFQHWGTAQNVFYFLNNINAYTNKEYIEIEFVEHLLNDVVIEPQLVMTDLGGDDGFLLDEISKLLRQRVEGLEIRGYVVDVDSTGKAEQKFKKKQEIGEREGLKFIKSDVTMLPFNDGSVNIVVSRMTMQYLNHNQQEKFYFEIDRILKKGGIAQIMTIEADDTYNQIMEEVTFIVSGNHNFNRVFPNYNDFLELEEKLEKSGSSLHLVYRTDSTKMPLSVESFADRFKLTGEQVRQLKELYELKAKEYPDIFEMIDGTLCLNTRIMFQQYRKD